MEQSVSQIMQHQLALTPSLRLSLEILQMPLMQLQAYLRQQLEENPVLETDDPAPLDDLPPEPAFLDQPLANFEESMADLWRQVDGSPADNTDDPRPRPETPGRGASLHDHLVMQLRCMQADHAERDLAERLLAWLDPDGYLRTPLALIAESEQCAVDALEAALPRLHQLDPPGVGARNVAECLLIQLRHRGLEQHLAARLLREQPDLFLKRQIATLASRLHATVDEIQDAYRLIATLEPKPARNFDASPAAFQTADLIVYDRDGRFDVELNDRGTPAIHLSRLYRGMLRDPQSPPDAKLFLRDKMHQAVWVLKAIAQRKSTLLAIGQQIVRHERHYLRYGVSHLRALTQERIATEIGCHPSTVSRAIAGKTMETPFGIVPLERFFGGGVAIDDTPDSPRVASQTIQAELTSLVEQEDPAAPLSDQAIADALRTKGYPIARRTVAKYRTELKILPAKLRKRCF